MSWSQIPGDHVMQLLLQHSGLTYKQLHREMTNLDPYLDAMDLLNCVWELATHDLLILDGHSESGRRLCDAIGRQAQFSFDPNKRGKQPKLRASKHYLEVRSALGLLSPRSLLRARESVGEMFLGDTGKGTAVTAWPLFGEPRPLIKQPDIFVVMPFSRLMLPIYRDHIAPAATSLKLTTMRADDLFTNNSVIGDVWSGIFHSRAIIADCTGRNPNVFYEIGVAHCLGKDTILISQHSDDVPVDIRHMKYIAYEYTPPGMKEFERQLISTLCSVCNVRDA